MPGENGERIEDLAEGLLIKGSDDKGKGDVRDDKAKTTTDEASGDDVDDWNSEEEQPSDDEVVAKKDGDEGDEEGAKEGEGDEVDPTEPLYTVKVDGKSQQVPLKEALAGYQRTQDYTAKTQQLAEQRKLIEQEAAATRAAREQYDAVLKTLQERLGTEADEPTQAQWDALKQENPEHYALAYTDYQRRKDARAAIKAEQERVLSEKTVEQRKQFSEYLAKENEALLSKMSAWKDPEKRKAGSKAIFDFATKQYGFTDEEMSKAYDHRMVVMAEDARKYHALRAKMDAGKKKLETAPDVPPRARGPQLSAKMRQRAEAEKRFNKTGSIDDGVTLLLS